MSHHSNTKTVQTSSVNNAAKIKLELSQYCFYDLAVILHQKYGIQEAEARRIFFYVIDKYFIKDGVEENKEAALIEKLQQKVMEVTEKLITDSERAWKVKLRKGDNAAFREVYTSCFPNIQKMVLKNSGNASDAAEVMQYAAIELLKKLSIPTSPFQKMTVLEASVEAYVGRIAYWRWLKRLLYLCGLE